MKISYDPDKRDKTLRERGLNFEDADKVFAGVVVEIEDDRVDYGERRLIAYGMLDGRAVAIVWTPRDDGRRIISMRHVHDEELAARRKALD